MSEWSPAYTPVSEQQPEGSAPPQSAASGAERPAWVTAAALAGVLVVGALIGFFIGRGTADEGDEGGNGLNVANSLQAAYDECTRLDSDSTMTIADEGRSILIDTRSEYGDPAAMDCVLRELDTPESVQAQIARTTSMMGVQEADHEGLHYSWTYHPDNGVNMTIEVAAA